MQQLLSLAPSRTCAGHVNPKNNPSNAPIGKHGGVPDVGESSHTPTLLWRSAVFNKLDVTGA